MGCRRDSATDRPFGVNQAAPRCRCVPTCRRCHRSRLHPVAVRGHYRRRPAWHRVRSESGSRPSFDRPERGVVGLRVRRLVVLGVWLRSAWSIPFFAIALGLVLITVQIFTDEPLRDVIAYVALGLLFAGSIAGVGFLALRRPFGLFANIVLGAFLLLLAYAAFVGSVSVGSSFSTSIGYGPPVVVGWVLILPGIALIRTRSTATVWWSSGTPHPPQ